MQPQFIDTPLKAAVEEAARLLDAFGGPDEEQFRSTIETIDPRVLATAGEFFDLMRYRGATLRVVEVDHSFGAEAVARAADRATSTKVEDVDEEISGQLAGVLPDAHQFEFHESEYGSAIQGRVDRSLAADQLVEFNRNWVNGRRPLLLSWQHCSQESSRPPRAGQAERLRGRGHR